MIENDLKPRDIVGRDSLRNAAIVAMAIGGSTNALLHAPEIARAAGFADFWKDIITPEEFNHLSQHVVPVLTNARPYGKYSMVDIDRVGGVQIIVRELLEAGLLNGDVLTCTGETLAEQVARLGAKRADGEVIYPVEAPYKPTGGLRMLGGNLSPKFSAILKLAGVEGGLENNLFRGYLSTFAPSQERNTEVELGLVVAEANGTVEIRDYRNGQIGKLLGTEPVKAGGNPHVDVEITPSFGDAVAVLKVGGNIVDTQVLNFSQHN
jgi:dihydroxy-acid dehydratase